MSNSIISLMNDIFDEDLTRWVMSPVSRSRVLAPAINVKEMEGKYEISLRAPGIDYNKLKIELHDKILNIAYEDEVENKEEKANFVRQEWSSYSFSRSVMLPKNVDHDSIEADYDRGVVTIHVNKLPESQPKRIQIKPRSSENK